MDNKKKQNEEKRTPKEMLHNSTGSLFTHFWLSFVFVQNFPTPFVMDSSVQVELGEAVVSVSASVSRHGAFK